MANLAIFAGVRKDITQMPADEQDILTNLVVDCLINMICMVKWPSRKKMILNWKCRKFIGLPPATKGVFVNATPGENFGLTIVEAAACGLPVVASPTGGPKEILEHCNNGLLVDVEDPAEIAEALKKIIADQALMGKIFC